MTIAKQATNGEYYITRQRKWRKDNTIWMIKYGATGNHGQLLNVINKTTMFPPELVGKKIRFKIEVIE